MSDLKRILVVDDEPSVRALIPAILHEKYEVLACASAEEALELLKTERVDAVVSDFLMPGIDGISFLTTLSKLYPDVSGVLITGCGDYPEIQEALRSSRFTILFKPFENEKLRCWIDNAVMMTQIRRDTNKLRARRGL